MRIRAFQLLGFLAFCVLQEAHAQFDTTNLHRSLRRVVVLDQPQPLDSNGLLIAQPPQWTSGLPASVRLFFEADTLPVLDSVTVVGMDSNLVSIFTHRAYNLQPYRIDTHTVALRHFYCVVADSVSWTPSGKTSLSLYRGNTSITLTK